MFLLSGQKGKDAMLTDSRIGRGSFVPEYRHPLVQKITPYLRCLHGLKDPAAKRSVRWTPWAVGVVGVLMSLDYGCSLTTRFQDALACLGVDRRRVPRTGQTYNGLLKAMVRQAPMILPRLKADLREQARAALAYVPRVHGWTLLAVDGSKEDLPRTQALEKRFGIADNGHTPQALMTSIVEVSTGLPWDWRMDRGRGSERDCLLKMVPDLPESSLLLADAYYMGYPLWSALTKAGRHFLIRVGGHARLLRGLWPQTSIEQHRDIVYAWPSQRQKTCPPLRLRLIKVQGGKDPVYVLTNVLDHRRLTKAAAGKIYRRRWGVEIFYRTLKRTLGATKLRSRSDQRAAVELEWYLITVCIMTLLGIDRLHRQGRDCRRLSAAGLLEVLRASLLRGMSAPFLNSLPKLDRQLGQAVRDNYRRKAPKHSRYRPITKNTPRPRRLKPPQVRTATPAERRRALQYHSKWAA